MIRFVDLRGQGTGYRFALWSTVIDRFMEFDGEQAWDTREDLLAAINAGAEHLRKSYAERLMPLLPDWVDQPLTDAKCFLPQDQSIPLV